ncbi:sodium ion-translocating decarboxylase subunit beta [bacterium]|nr:sodium ion-translocating decarboxylase subunit beta [bacterium]
MSISITEGLQTLWDSTGIMGFTHSFQNAMANSEISGVEQILEAHGQWIMILICLFLLWLGIKKQFEPLLLVPIAFGGLLSNIPMPLGEEIAGPNGFLGIIFEAGIHKGLFPLIIFMGVGAMTDFGPLIANPKMALLGGAAQFGIFGALLMAYCLFGFSMPEAASIGIIGGADGPTSIYVTTKLAEHLLGPIAVAAYSYMALVPVIQPPIMKLLTTKAEREIKMEQLRDVSKREKIVFPLMILLLCVILLPSACPLLGALCFGNLCKECGVVERLSDTMQNALINIVTIFLGLSVGSKLSAGQFLTVQTLFILLLGVIAFSLATAAGVLMAKLMNCFSKTKINPLIGSAGVSAVPMAARVANKVGLEANPQNFLLMHAMGPNVSGVIGSAVAAGVLLALCH